MLRFHEQKYILAEKVAGHVTWWRHRRPGQQRLHPSINAACACSNAVCVSVRLCTYVCICVCVKNVSRAFLRSNTFRFVVANFYATTCRRRERSRTRFRSCFPVLFRNSCTHHGYVHVHPRGGKACLCTIITRDNVRTIIQDN